MAIQLLQFLKKSLILVFVFLKWHFVNLPNETVGGVGGGGNIFLYTEIPVRIMPLAIIINMME